mmetsp:Transcript_10043/g.15049  ORF Transcript_10043/g.15049 Transcript_10043/m.15049 type:complete len:195 (+) Transcript_10043:786-1370(+)
MSTPFADAMSFHPPNNFSSRVVDDSKNFSSSSVPDNSWNLCNFLMNFFRAFPTPLSANKGTLMGVFWSSFTMARIFFSQDNPDDCGDDDDNDDDDDDLSVCSIELQSLVEKLDGIQEIGDDDDDDDDPLINYDLRLNLSMDDERLSKHRDDLIEHCSLSLHEHDDIQEHHEEYHFEEQFDQKEQPIVSQELNSL